jgi:hypothetical protein
VAFSLSTVRLRNMSSPDTDKFDPSRRRLCPDGACVGLLDDNGRCKECGRTASGKIEAGSAPAPVEDDYSLGEERDQVEAAAPDEVSSGGFDPSRKLCPDGACVGVIGADGRCKVCGQAG